LQAAENDTLSKLFAEQLDFCGNLSQQLK